MHVFGAVMAKVYATQYNLYFRFESYMCSLCLKCEFSVYALQHTGRYVCEGLRAVTHAVDCSDSRLCGEDSVVQ